MNAPQPLALRRAQHTLADEHGFRAFGTLPDVYVPHVVARVDGRPAVLVWWSDEPIVARRALLATAALLGDRDDVAYIWAVTTGASGDGLAMRVGPEGVVAIERLPDVEAFRAPPIHAPLDAVDWNRLTDAYGPATATRDHLHTLLTAADPAERADAIYRLYLGICHQTVSLAEATAPSIPFLVAAGERPDAVGVLRLLTDIAELAGLPVDDVPADEAAWSRRCAMALGAAAPRIAAWVQGADVNPRRAAALRLALAVRRTAPGAAAPLDAVLDAALGDPDPVMRMLAVRSLSADGERDRLGPALGDGELRVRAFAALPLLTAGEPARRAKAWAVVAEALADLDVAERWFEDAPGLEGDAPMELLEAIAAAGRPAADAVGDGLIALLAREQYSARLGPLIRVFWPDRRVPDDPAAVDPLQTAALAALARNRRFWRAGERHILPAPFDGETEWREFRDRVAALPARAALPPERAAVDFDPRPPAEVAAELIRDAVRGHPGDDPAMLGRAVRRLVLGPELCDPVFAALCAACPLLDELELERPRLTDAGLAPIAGLGHLRTLRASGLDLHGHGLAALAALTRLRSIHLVEPGFDDRALIPLARLPRLGRLALTRAPLLGEGLAALADAPRLTELCVADGPLEPAAWSALGRLPTVTDVRLAGLTLPRAALADWRGPALTRLWLDGCVVPPGALCDLPPLAHLRRVTLSGCAVDEAELAALGGLPRLMDLELCRTPLSAAAVEVLAGLVGRIRLSLVETGLSAAAIRALRRRRRR